MIVYISSDHGGFSLKERLLLDLKLNGIDLVDLGPNSLDLDDDYPDYALLLAQKVSQRDDTLGILICRSGNGMCIAANKVKGAYASLCFSKFHAQKAREDDNANILCLGADYAQGDSPEEIITAFVSTEFKGIDTKYGRRFKKIQEFEQSNMIASNK